MNALEVAVYALVLSGGGTQPFSCSLDAVKADVVCTNGLAAKRNADGNIEFDNGVQVVRLMDGRLAFSNGVNTHWGSAGWVQFSTGLSVRRQTNGSFRFSNGMTCEAAGEGKATCAGKG